MRQVRKYKFADGSVTVPVSTAAKVVHFARQQDEICVWVEDLVDAYTNMRLALQVVGTGHEIHDDKLEHMGSLSDGPWVWHLYGNRVMA